MINIGYMVAHKSWLKSCAVACFFFSFLFVSCNGGTESNATQDEGEDNTVEVVEDDVVEDQVFFQIPSPDEMIGFIKEGGAEYDGTVLNPVDNLDLYVDQRSKAFNLGIYTADLTYMATYGEFQESIKYFNVIMKLADQLGVSSAFDEGLADRVKNNLESTDSLEIITRDSYYSIVDNLEQSQRGKALAVIASGGWLESVYIVVNLVQEYNAEDPVIQRIADQKLVFENLMLYLEKYKDEDMVATTISDMETLKSIFKSFEETSSSTSLEKEGGKMVLGGKGKVNITEEQYNNLKAEIIGLRNSMAAINS